MQAYTVEQVAEILHVGRRYAAKASQGTPGLPRPWQGRRHHGQDPDREVPGHDLPGRERLHRRHRPRLRRGGPAPARQRKGRTKAAVKDKLTQLVEDKEKGIQTDQDTENYTVAEAVSDWLAKGTRNLDEDTVGCYRILAGKHLVPAIGATKRLPS